MKKNGNICDEKKLQVIVKMEHFENPKEREDLMKNLKIGAEFDMRHRGHFLFYGKDFITYKLERPYDKDRNEFLRKKCPLQTRRHFLKVIWRKVN